LPGRLRCGLSDSLPFILRRDLHSRVDGAQIPSSFSDGYTCSILWPFIFVDFPFSFGPLPWCYPTPFNSGFLSGAVVSPTCWRFHSLHFHFPLFSVSSCLRHSAGLSVLERFSLTGPFKKDWTRTGLCTSFLLARSDQLEERRCFSLLPWDH